LAAEAVSIRLRLSLSFWGRVRGTVSVGSTQGEELTAEVLGRSLLGQLSLSIDDRPSMSASVDQTRNNNPLRLPSRFEGRHRTPDELGGSWRTMTIWMVGPRRQLVPVVLAEGTWVVQRSKE
jgi:hypothetical protein